MGKKSKNRKKGRARSAQQPEIKTRALWTAVVFAAIGMALSLYATRLTFTIATQGITGSSGCSINEWINCDLAHASSYARLLGIPVAWWGLLFYLFAGLSALFGAMSSNRRSASAYVSAAWILSIGAVLFSVYKATDLWQLRVLCPVCVGMYLANVGLMFSLPSGLNVRVRQWGSFLSDYVHALRGRDSSLLFAPKPGAMLLTIGILFGVGYAGVLNYERGITVQSNINLDASTRAHFRQTPIQIATDPQAGVWGNPEAELTIVEFADFQCPACRESALHLRTALWEFRNDIKFVFMNFPLTQHNLARRAASANICAGEFGDFWGFHDQLFENQVSLGNPLYTRLVEERGWDTQAFGECMARQDVEARIDRDLEAGRATKLSSTPTIFINGRKISYWNNYDFIRAVIRKELSRL